MKVNNLPSMTIPKTDKKWTNEKNAIKQNDMVLLGSKESNSEAFLKPLSIQTANSESQAYVKGCSALIGGGALVGGGYVGGLFAGTIIGYKLQGIIGAATGAAIGSILCGKIGTFIAKELFT